MLRPLVIGATDDRTPKSLRSWSKSRLFEPFLLARLERPSRKISHASALNLALGLQPCAAQLAERGREMQRNVVWFAVFVAMLAPMATANTAVASAALDAR